MNKLLALVLFAVYTAAGPTNVVIETSKNFNCLEHDNEFFSCVFVKTISALDRAARSSDIKIFDGVTFVRDIPMERIGKSLKNEEEIMNELPRDNSDKAKKLCNMLYNSVVSFVKSHSLKLSMPEGSISRSLVEGRAKIKKLVMPLIAAAGLKLVALIPILLGLSLLALKALVLGKIALLVAGAAAFQRLFGNNVAGSFFNKNPAPVWYDNGATGSWAAGGASGIQGYRNFDKADVKVDAHDLAYSAHAPVATGTD